MDRSVFRMTVKKQRALDAIDAKKKRLFEMSDSLWEHPEICYHETFASRLFYEALLEEGFEVETELAGIGTAFSGSFGRGAPVIGILGEFDAVPGMSQEAGRTEQKAILAGDAGHGCGHNLLGVGSLAAAIAVKRYLEESGAPGTVKFFGCPAEEGGAGKGFMSRDGAFAGLDIALSWHPGDVNAVSRESAMANYQICYRFFGRASHAAMSPEFGRSALDALELMNTGVQYLREHVPQNTRIHYAITNAGGSAPGIVQPYAEALYLMRAPRLPQVKELYERVNKIAQGAAMMTETRVEAEFVKACSDTVLNTELLRVLQANMELIGREAKSEEGDYEMARAFRATQQGSTSYFDELLADVTDPDERARLKKNADSAIHDVVMPFPAERQGFASSDVGDVSYLCPVAQVTVVTMPAGTAMHSWQAVAVGKSGLAKNGMLFAGKILAAAAIDAIEDPSIIERAKEELRRRTNGEAYRSPIPAGVKPRIP
jgi:aminobenzoyl-glutamate utilization protein B